MCVRISSNTKRQWISSCPSPATRAITAVPTGQLLVAVKPPTNTSMKWLHPAHRRKIWVIWWAQINTTNSICNHSFWDDSPRSSFASTRWPRMGKRWRAGLGSASHSFTTLPGLGCLRALPLLPTAMSCSICSLCMWWKTARYVTSTVRGVMIWRNRWAAAMAVPLAVDVWPTLAPQRLPGISCETKKSKNKKWMLTMAVFFSGETL